jgi:hypothetical protein
VTVGQAALLRPSSLTGGLDPAKQARPDACKSVQETRGTFGGRLRWVSQKLKAHLAGLTWCGSKKSSARGVARSSWYNTLYRLDEGASMAGLNPSWPSTQSARSFASFASCPHLNRW